MVTPRDNTGWSNSNEWYVLREPRLDYNELETNDTYTDGISFSRVALDVANDCWVKKGDETEEASKISYRQYNFIPSPRWAKIVEQL